MEEKSFKKMIYQLLRKNNEKSEMFYMYYNYVDTIKMYCISTYFETWLTTGAIVSTFVVHVEF